MSEELSLFQQCSAGLNTADDLAQIVECIADGQAEVGLRRQRNVDGRQ